MKVMHIIVSLDVGGAEMMLKRLINSQQGQKYFIHTVVSLTDIGRVGVELQAMGVEVHSLRMRNVLSIPRVLLALKKLISSSNVDIVQTWMYHADLLGGIAARFSRGPSVVWGIHSTYVAASGSWSTVLVMRVCALLSRWVPDAIVCVAEKSRKVHVEYGYDARRITVIPNGIDMSRFQVPPKIRSEKRRDFGFSHDEIVIGTIGRFNPAKDYSCFVNAAGIVAKENNKVRFLMLGLGLDRDNEIIQEWIHNTGFGDRFVLLGERTDTSECLAAMDIFCLSSRTEALPTVIAEAMAMETPCVATDVGDTALLLGRTGIVAPPRNPKALAEALKQMIAKPISERLEIGKRAKERIEAEYTIDRARIRYENLYKNLTL